MARSGKAQKKIADLRKGGLIKGELIEVTTIIDKEPQFIEDKKTKKPKSES